MNNKKILECGKDYTINELQKIGKLEFVRTDKYLFNSNIEMKNPIHVYKMVINNITVKFETIDDINFQCFQSV